MVAIYAIEVQSPRMEMRVLKKTQVMTVTQEPDNYKVEEEVEE